MFDLWKSELTEEECDSLVDKAAYEIKRRKLEAPAILMLETHKPLANVGGHVAIMFAPFVAPFVGFDKMNDFTRLLSSPRNIEKLLARLERKEESVSMMENQVG